MQHGQKIFLNNNKYFTHKYLFSSLQSSKYYYLHFTGTKVEGQQVLNLQASFKIL